MYKIFLFDKDADDLGEEEEGEDEEQEEEDDEGRAGSEQEEEADLRMAIEGDLSDEEFELARQEALEEVQDRGALAVLNQQGPTSIFGAGPSGSDAIMAIGATTGEGVGASYGTRGLGAYGGGLSGGGRHAL